jgi:hypothetical protein
MTHKQFNQPFDPLLLEVLLLRAELLPVQQLPVIEKCG